MHCASRSVIALRLLDCVVREAVAFEVQIWRWDNACFEALTIMLPQVGFELEEDLNAFGLQHWPLHFAANPACVGCVLAASAGEASTDKIELSH